MAATATKEKFSAGTDGAGVLVAATATAGTTIHTATASTTTTWDEIWLWASNTDTTNRKLTIEFGGTGTANLHEVTIPAESGPVLVIPGWILQNSKTVAAFAATTNVINCTGFVNRIVNS